MDWSLKITKVDNGYIAEYSDAVDEDGEIIGHRLVFPELDTENGELEAMQNLLWFVMEHFAIYGSDHDRYRLQVEVIDQHETVE